MSTFDYLFTGQLTILIVEVVIHSELETFRELCQHYLSCNNLSVITAPRPNSLHAATQAHCWHHE